MARRRIAWGAAFFGVTLAAAAALPFGPSAGGAGVVRDEKPAPEAIRAMSGGSESRADAVRAGIVPSTYKELATETSATGATVRLFEGIHDRFGLACMGLSEQGFTGLSCKVDLTRAVALQAHESMYLGHRMVSGLVSDGVAKVVIRGVDGHDVAVPIHNGTFFYDGNWGDGVSAFDSNGNVIGGYDLAD